MERNIVAYKIWAPFEAPWSQWAKPVLFVGEVQGPEPQWAETFHMEVPYEITNMYDKQTAIIVDLPGKLGVFKGLGLAKAGYRPVPLYNGVHEGNVGDLAPVVQNGEIVDALLSSARFLDDLPIATDAPPVFLLDSNRAMASEESDTQYDNRWSVDLEDVPNPDVLRRHGIDRLLLWTNGTVSEDLVPILAMYRAGGISVFTYRDETFFEYYGETPLQQTPVRFRRRLFWWRPLARRRRLQCRYGAPRFGFGTGSGGKYSSGGYGGKAGYKGFGGYGGKGFGGYGGKGFSGFKGGFGGGYGG